MTSFSLKNQSIRIVGATFVLLATAATPSRAASTKLSGFTTYGDMMRGMRVTATFLDGSFETTTWRATDDKSGGAFGNGWSLTESDNTYNSAWTLSNSVQGITSIAIDAIPGNTLFDTYPNLEGPLQTPGSAEGWEFQTLSGQNPDYYRYSDPIDISYGDLFGTLSLYWNGGFTGKMKFRADTDSGTSDRPVRPREPALRDTAPTVSLSTPTIYEGQSASGFLSATEPSEDAITFFLNDRNLGTIPSMSGTRSTSTNLGFFADNGEYTYTARARNEQGRDSTATSTLTVLNVAPTITDIQIPTIYEGQSAVASVSAIDPGADSISFLINGINSGTDPNTSGTRTINTNLGNFADNGYIPYTIQAVDKDGGASTAIDSGLTVLNVSPTLTDFRLSRRVIYQGQSVRARLFDTDPGADSQTFFINGKNVGTDLQTSGTRSVRTNLGTFTTPGTYTFRAKARDKDGAESNRMTRRLTVLNADPIITDLTGDLSVTANDVFNFAANGADPGNDALTFNWDFNGDGIYDDYTGATGEWSFGDVGTYQVGLQVSDGNGGSAYNSFTVNVGIPGTAPNPGTVPLNVDPPGTAPNPGTVPDPATAPEPTSILGILTFGALGTRAVWKRKQRQKANE